MTDSLRPPVFTRGRLIAVGVVAVSVVLVTVVLPRYVRARDDRARAELDQAMAPYVAEARTLSEQLVVRLSPIAALDGEGVGACPPKVVGDLPLVQRSWLVYALDRTKVPYPTAKPINSPAFDYLSGYATPGFNVDLLAQRNVVFRTLLAAPYVVISSIAKASEIRPTGEATFEGGAIVADLLVIDVAAARIVCRTTMTSQPDLVISLRQDNGAITSDEREAIRDAFWAAAQKQLASIAPAAHLVHR